MYSIEVDGFKWEVEFHFFESDNGYEPNYFTAVAQIAELTGTGREYGEAFITINRINVHHCHISRKLDETPTRGGGDYNTKHWRYSYEYIKRQGVFSPEVTDAVKSKLRKAGDKAILLIAEQVGETKWKNDAKREYWTEKIKRQTQKIKDELETLTKMQKQLALVEDLLKDIENAPH